MVQSGCAAREGVGQGIAEREVDMSKKIDVEAIQADQVRPFAKLLMAEVKWLEEMVEVALHQLIIWEDTNKLREITDAQKLLCAALGKEFGYWREAEGG